MVEDVKQRLGDAVLGHETACGDDVLLLPAEGVHAALRMLRDAFAFEQLADLFGMDAGPAGPPEGRFTVVYHLVSLSRRRRLRIKVRLPAADPVVDSAADLWTAADWMEREAYDLFGIRFRNHPDLRRILMSEGFDGWPLRKDYPLEGRGERDAFPSCSTQTPLGDLLREQGDGALERLA